MLTPFPPPSLLLLTSTTGRLMIASWARRRFWSRGRRWRWRQRRGRRTSGWVKTIMRNRCLWHCLIYLNATTFCLHWDYLQIAAWQRHRHCPLLPHEIFCNLCRSVAEDLSLKDKALLFKTDATTNLNVAEDLSRLNWFVDIMGAHTNDAKVLHETLVVKRQQCEDAAWNFRWWSNGLTCEQCKDTAWNFLWLSNGLTRQQCEDGAWNIIWWSDWLKSCMRMNPTINQFWTQIRMESF